MKFLKQFIDDESGATAVEYGLLAGLIAMACIGAFTSFGQQIVVNYTDFTTSMADAGS